MTTVARQKRSSRTVAVRDLHECSVVVLTRSRWDEPPRIRHQIARQLSRYCQVIFAETPVDWRERTRFAVERVEANLIRVTLGNPAPIPRKVLRYVEPLNQYVQRSFVDALRDEVQGEIILLNFNPDLGSAIGHPGFALSAYFCNDDFGGMESREHARRAVGRQERRTATAADLCLAVSVPLVEKLRQWNPSTHLVLPAHDFEIRPRTHVREAPQAVTRVGFMGYVNDRLDDQWLDAVASQPDMAIELIGPIDGSADRVRALLQTGRVQHRPALTGAPLQAALEACDVLVMPYDLRIRAISAATAPNKLFAYLAAGKPIVISAMPHFIELGHELIYRARTAEEFVAAIRRARAEDCDELRSRRMAIAAENTWDVRGEQLRERLEHALDQRRARSRPGVELSTHLHNHD